MTLRNQLRFGRSTRDSIATPPRFASPDSTAINREMRSWLTEDEIWDNQTDLRAKFSTGFIQHSLVAGLALTREDNERVTRTAPVMLTTLLNPNPNDTFTGAITVGPIVGDIIGNSIAAYAFDNVKARPEIRVEWWSALGLLRRRRHQYYRRRNNQDRPNAQLEGRRSL